MPLKSSLRQGFIKLSKAQVDEQGHLAEFDLMTNSEDKERVAMAAMIKDDLSKLGIHVHLKPVQFNVLLSTMRIDKHGSLY